MHLKSVDSGYTLVEVIIAIQIFLMVVTFTYTIYLFGFRFMSDWNDRQDLQSTELTLNRVIISELGSAREVIALYPTKIEYLNDRYRIKSIHWQADSLYLNSKEINLPGVIIKISGLNFVGSSGEHSFQELDLNTDGILLEAEMKDVKALRLEYQLTSKKHQINNYILLALKNKTFYRQN
jgi:prepilin-type N-terminal cleavage/methylation domain-containing protein